MYLPSTSREWLSMESRAVTKEFAEFTAATFATPDQTDALPVILPAYNRDEAEISRLPWTLASLAVASHESGQSVRPLVIVNGPRQGSAYPICRSFGLEPDIHLFQEFEKGKVRAIQAAVGILLQTEEYEGPFATIDDDGLVPPQWAARVVNHMQHTQEDAISAGTIRYYSVPETSRTVVCLRNKGVPYRERRSIQRLGGVCAHGNNQWFNAGPEGKVRQAILSLDSDIGRGGDAAIVVAVRDFGADLIPIDKSPAARVWSAGNRTKSLSDLVQTAIGGGASRYDDYIWGDQRPFTLR